MWLTPPWQRIHNDMSRKGLEMSRQGREPCQLFALLSCMCMGAWLIETGLLVTASTTDIDCTLCSLLSMRSIQLLLGVTVTCSQKDKQTCKNGDVPRESTCIIVPLHWCNWLRNNIQGRSSARHYLGKTTPAYISKYFWTQSCHQQYSKTCGTGFL